MTSVEKGTLIDQHTTDTVVTTRTIKTRITDGPIVEHEEKVRGWGPKSGTTRIYRHQIRSVTAILEMDKPWQVTIGVQRIKKDGADAQMSRVLVGAWHGWSLKTLPEILEFRDTWLADQGIGLDQIQEWG